MVGDTKAAQILSNLKGLYIATEETESDRPEIPRETAGKSLSVKDQRTYLCLRSRPGTSRCCQFNPAPWKFG